MNATNKKAIEILKSKMTLEERKYFVENINIKLLPYIQNIQEVLYSTFVYKNSKQGSYYWHEIYSRFTQEELEQKIDVK